MIKQTNKQKKYGFREQKYNGKLKLSKPIKYQFGQKTTVITGNIISYQIWN